MMESPASIESAAFSQKPSGWIILFETMEEVFIESRHPEVEDNTEIFRIYRAVWERTADEANAPLIYAAISTKCSNDGQFSPHEVFFVNLIRMLRPDVIAGGLPATIVTA